MAVLVPINKVMVHVNEDQLSYKSVSPVIIVIKISP
jgi:hypothetical protein